MANSVERKCPIKYVLNPTLEASEVAQLFLDSGLNRPSDDLPRIQMMLDNANLIIVAMEGDRLIGIARALSDFAFATYLSDLAVHKDYQKSGIGKKLIQMVKEEAGEASMLLLLSVPTAMDYYPKVGMENVGNAFLIKRK